MFARALKPAGRAAAGVTLVATAATIAALLPATAAFAADTVTNAAPSSATNDASKTITFTTTDAFVVAQQPTVTLTNTNPPHDTLTAPGTVTPGPLTGNTVAASLPFTLANPGVYDISIAGPGGSPPMPSITDTCTSTQQHACFTVTDANPLSVSGASPNEIQASSTSSSSATVTVTGTGFAKGTKVQVVDSSNQPVSNITYGPTSPQTDNTATTIKQVFTVASNTVPGSYYLQVTNTDGTTAVCSAACFTVAAPMQVNSVSPPSLQIGATGKTVTISGSGFSSQAVAKFSHQDATHTDATEVAIGSQSVSADHSTITLSNVSVSNTASPETLDLTISSASDSVTDRFTGVLSIVGPPKPTSVSYDSNPNVNNVTKQDYGQGATAVTLTVHGTGFVADTPDCTGGNGTRVTISPIGGVTVNSECATSTTVAVNLTLDRTAPTGNRTLTVTNPNGTSATCNNGNNTTANTCVLAIAAAPSITQPYPSLPVGQTGNVTIHGTFDGQQTKNDIQITDQTVNSVSSASTSSITANVTAGSTAKLEDITLSNPSDHGVATCTGCFSVNSIAVNSATTTGASGSSQPDNSSDATVHIQGSGFDPQHVSVKFVLPNAPNAGTFAAAVQSSPAEPDPTSTDLYVSAPLKGAEPGDYQVIVTNTGSTPGQGSCSCFTIKDANGGPTISKVTPNSLPAGSSGQTLVIQGADFYPDSTVSFSFPANGGGQATVKSVHYDGSQQLTVVVDVASGVSSNQTGTVTVTNTDGHNGSSAFTITAAPSVSPVTPSSEPINTTQFTMTFGANNAQSGATVDFPGATGLTAGPTTIGAADSSTPSGFNQKVSTMVTVGPGAKVGTFDVRLTNPDHGSGSCIQCFSLTAIPPAAPTGVSGTPGNQQVTVSWTAPNDNGSRIDSYTITTTPGGGKTTVNAPDANHPAPTSGTVTGLTNGTAYTFTVTAHNAAGDGPASAASAPVTPVAKPNAPTNVAATAGDTKATVTWTAPTPPSGDTIKDYVIKSNPSGPTASAGATATTADVTGLTNGSAYTFTVVVEYTSGATADSTASNSVTPFGKPLAPSNVAASSSDGQTVTVTWTAPSSNGAAIDSYTVTASPGGKTVTVTGSGSSAPATTATVSGLSTGSTYTFTVTAHNKAGDSPASAPSNSVTLGSPGPLAGTALSIATTTGHITAGQHARLFGSLADGNGKPIGGATITLLGRTVSGTSVVGTTTTAADGSWSMFPAPRHSTTYTASYAGSPQFAKATSGPGLVTVAPKITIKAAQVTSSAHPLVVTGSVSPNKAGHIVRLIAVNSHGVRKTFKATLSGSSTYKFKAKLAKGKWTLVVTIGSTSGNTAGHSNGKSVKRT